MTLADQLRAQHGDRAVDGLWCNVPAKQMLAIITALSPRGEPDERLIEQVRGLICCGGRSCAEEAINAALNAQVTT